MPNQRLLYRVEPAAVVTVDAATDGSDVTTSMQAQIDAAPDGAGLAPTIINIPAGRYHTEGDLANNARGANGIIRLDGRSNLVIQGPSPENPAVLYTEAPAVPYDTSVGGGTFSLRRHVYVTNCENITFRNIRIEGSNYTEGPDLAPGTPSFWEGPYDNGSRAGFPGYRASWELEHAFAFHECRGILVEDFSIDSVWGDGVYVGNDSGCNDVTIRRGVVRFPGRQGIAVACGGNINLHEIEIIKGRRSSLDLEPHLGHLVIDGVDVRNFVCEQIGTGIACLGTGDVSNVTVHDMTITGGGTIVCRDSYGIARRRNWTIRRLERVDPFGSPEAGMQFGKVDNILLDDCTHRVWTTQSRRIVRFNDCQGIEIRNCDFSPGGCYIQVLDGSSEPVLSNNIFACP
jgi:hypothetical protein